MVAIETLISLTHYMKWFKVDNSHNIWLHFSENLYFLFKQNQINFYDSVHGFPLIFTSIAALHVFFIASISSVHRISTKMARTTSHL